MTQAILEEIERCMSECDLQGLQINVTELLQDTSEFEASKELSMLLYKRYTTFNEESIAKLMEVIIQTNPQLALVSFPENFLFRVAVLRGSMELYQCYMEEAIDPYLLDKNEDEVFDCYSDLYSIADRLTEAFFPKYEKCIKGLEFNGAFGEYEGNASVVLINREDYQVMDEVVERYNTIVGRRDIVKDLGEKMGPDLSSQ